MTVLATHVVLSMYGFWLPNDPRGSWSSYTGSRDLFLAGGKATKVDTRRSVAANHHDRNKREETKRELKYPPVVLSGIQARAVARGFSILAEEHPVYACAIMPQHAHLVLARSPLHADKIVGRLKTAAEKRLREENIFPDCESIWAQGFWQVFLNTPADVHRTIRYVEDNPTKDGLKTQRWSFVTKPSF